MNSTLRLLIAAVLVQTPLSTPIKVGTRVDILTEREVATLSALPGVLNPWMLDAKRTQAGSILVEIYLPASFATSNLRRGTVIGARRAWNAPEGSPWGLPSNSQSTYAQVAIEGRSMDQILSDLDVNRPFQVRGSFTDDELVEIVRLIRSNPTAQTSNMSVPSVVRGNSRPIRLLSRSSADLVVVDLSIADMRLERVTLQRQGSTWVVVSAMEGGA